MKKISCILFVLFFSSTINADETSKAELQLKLSQLASFSANFKQKVTDVTGEELQTAEGKLYLQQPQKLFWDSYEPNEMQLIADGETLWHVDPFVEQVVAISQQDAAQNHPIMLLSQHDSPLWQHYLVEEPTENHYSLVSTLPDSEFTALTLVFNKDQLASLSIVDKMDQTNHLNFSDVQQNQKLPGSLFQFEIPQGYELDDQR